MPEIEIKVIPFPVAITNVTTSTGSGDPNEVVTEFPHEAQTGEAWSIIGVNGLSIDGATRQITVVDTRTFSLDTNSDTGTYSGGGKTSPFHEVRTISASLASGPFFVGTKIYIVLENSEGLGTWTSGTSTVSGRTAGLEMWSMDPDDTANTRVRHDSINEPLVAGTATRSIPVLFSQNSYAVKSGTNIHVLFQGSDTSSGNQAEIIHQIFDAGTDTWGTAFRTNMFERNRVGFTPAGHFHLAAGTGDELHIIYNGIVDITTAGTFGRVYYNKYDGTAWGTSTKVFGPAATEQKHYGEGGIVFDSSNNLIHLVGFRTVPLASQIWNAQSEILHQSIDGTGGTSSTTAISSSGMAWQQHPSGHFFGYNDGTDYQLVLSYPEGTNTTTITTLNPIVKGLNVLSAVSAATPTWSETVIATGSQRPPTPGNSANGGASSNIGVFAWESNNSRLHLFWASAANLGTTTDNPFEIYRKQYSGSWGTSIQYKTGEGQTADWNAASTVDSTSANPGPIWYGFPNAASDGSGVRVVFGKFWQWRVVDGFTANAVPRGHEFPHIDTLETCPVAGSSGGNYAYLS